MTSVRAGECEPHPLAGGWSCSGKAAAVGAEKHTSGDSSDLTKVNRQRRLTMYGVWVYGCILARRLREAAAYTMFTRSSKRPALARVFWIHLLEVCWTFAGSYKRGISHRLTRRLSDLSRNTRACVPPEVLWVTSGPLASWQIVGRVVNRTFAGRRVRRVTDWLSCSNAANVSAKSKREREREGENTIGLRCEAWLTTFHLICCRHSADWESWPTTSFFRLRAIKRNIARQLTENERENRWARKFRILRKRKK